jgi:hypothetical protein
MNTTVTALGAPLAPTSPRWSAMMLAGRAGRREGGIDPDPATGHTTYTREVYARANTREATLGQNLHDAVEPIDAQFLSLCAQIAHHATTLQELQATSEHLTATTEQAGSPADIRQRRALRAVDTRQQRTGAAVQDALPTLAALLGARMHLLDQARAAVAGHASHAATLAAAHRRGLQRRRQRLGLEPTTAPLPTYTSMSHWVTGDMPLLAANLDPATHDVAQWVLRQFHPSLDSPAPQAPTHLTTVRP